VAPPLKGRPSSGAAADGALEVLGAHRRREASVWPQEPTARSWTWEETRGSEALSQRREPTARSRFAGASRRGEAPVRRREPTARSRFAGASRDGAPVRRRGPTARPKASVARRRRAAPGAAGTDGPLEVLDTGVPGGGATVDVAELVPTFGHVSGSSPESGPMGAQNASPPGRAGATVSARRRPGRPEHRGGCWADSPGKRAVVWDAGIAGSSAPAPRSRPASVVSQGRSGSRRSLDRSRRPESSRAVRDRGSTDESSRAGRRSLLQVGGGHLVGLRLGMSRPVERCADPPAVGRMRIRPGQVDRTPGMGWCRWRCEGEGGQSRQELPADSMPGAREVLRGAMCSSRRASSGAATPASSPWKSAPVDGPAWAVPPRP
jgi:hypothetical protein